MARIVDGGGRKETAAQRNARLQAAFNKTSTSTKITTRRLTSYVPAPSYKAPSTPRPTVSTRRDEARTPSVPKVTSPAVPQSAYTHEASRMAQVDRTTTVPELTGPLGWTVPEIPTITETSRFVAPTTPQPTPLGPERTPGTQVQDPYLQTLSQLGVSLPDGAESTWQRSIDFVSQGSTQTYEDQQVAYAARLTGEAIFNYGQIPNVISTTVANQLPYTYYGYSSADQFLEDLGYFEQNPGQWIQGDGGGTTSDDTYSAGTTQSGTASYGRATTSNGYTNRYAGASTGLINWRIGF